MGKDKTPAMTKALKNLTSFLKENNLDPTINWSKDPKYGKQYTRLINLVNLERDKLTLVYPTRDLKNEVKLIKFSKMKKEKNAKVKAEKEAKVKENKKKVEKKSTRKATKYDYPLIDGREMTSEEKKKYRMEQRKLAQGKVPKEKKEKKEKVEKEKKSKKEVKAEAPKEKKLKKVKKAKKEED